MLVLHYTGMQDAASALARLTDPEAKVSAHYLVAEDGQVIRMVDEDQRAWHAGRSYWRGITDVNSASVGASRSSIPAMNSDTGPFPKAQVEAVIELTLAQIVHRHRITRGNVVGHSDVAPARKQDPGELFPWAQLAQAPARLAPPHQESGRSALE
jgi:N-acetylmuramoyl-L-alanine amidase